MRRGLQVLGVISCVAILLAVYQELLTLLVAMNLLLVFVAVVNAYGCTLVNSEAQSRILDLGFTRIKIDVTPTQRTNGD